MTSGLPGDDKEQVRINLNGGLTLIPAPGFDRIAFDVKQIIEGYYKDTPIDIVPPVIKLRASGEPCVQMGKEHIGGHDCVLITSGPGTYKMICETQFLLGQIVGRRARRLMLVTAYQPLSRTDKDEGDLEFALQMHVVHLFKSAAYGKLDRIIVVDLHSAQGVQSGGQLGFITEISLARRVLKRAVQDAIKEFPQAKIILIFPDENAGKRFRDAVIRVRDEITREHSIELRILHGQKIREDSRNSQFLGLFGHLGDIEALKGGIGIIFDDEISTFGTNYDVAHEIWRRYDPRALRSAAIHGVFSENAAERISSATNPISRIYITDTVPFDDRPHLNHLFESQRVVCVPWVQDLAQVIYHYHWGQSIREKR